MNNLDEIYCEIDDFCQAFLPLWQQQLLDSGERQRYRHSTLSMSEVMTLLILFHMSRFCDFKYFYNQYVKTYLRAEFPQLVSYMNKFKRYPTGFAKTDN
ncbi:hypothetical protein [Photorhabdus laumondii]|uniref:IS982 family transposase n=1 Tax=Photorhabdus laumondii subsp. clarkei TaxID=2029685 RepID=A0A329VCY6_9GAMM|nr:hypothetical protein [Photorhabdus laumondii]RAW86916.1 hypothetical protein CKY01_17565 [Photorhabdus laumondii subsp. clarkei]